MYAQLASEERHYIAISLKKGESMRQIGRDMGRSHTTISREI
ncbi:MAG: helix-turn-helix domain-containing protein, partial [Methylococcales symbiont of Iophon sp. n. MRB-2018]